MTDILNIEGEPIFDDRIVRIKTHMYNPYVNTTFKHSDKIRKIEDCQTKKMQIGSQRLEIIACRLTKFDTNSMVLRSYRNVEVTSLMKDYASYSDDFVLRMPDFRIRCLIRS